MGLLRSALLLLVMAAIPVGVYAAGRVTVDPNTPDRRGGASVAANEDPRLAQKVTYEAAHKPLKQIIADLAQLSGVTLTAGFSKQDWQVRDRKMNLFIKDLPLSELMDSIARVMKFKWERSDRTPPTYRLVQDRRLLGKLEAEATKREEELRNEVKRRRTAMVDSFAKVATASDAELSKLKDDNPYLYNCAESGLAKLVTQLIKDVPGLRDAITSGERNVSAPIAILPESTQRLYLDVLRRSYDYNKTWRRSKPLPSALDSELPKGLFQMELVPRPRESTLREQLSEFGGLGSPLSTGHYVLGMFRDSNSASAQILARTAQTVSETGTSLSDALRQVSPELGKAEQKKATETDYYLMMDPVTPKSDQPDDAALTAKVAIKIAPKAMESLQQQAKTLGDAAQPRLLYQASQQAIANAASLNVVSDSFAVMLGTYQPDGKEQDLRKTLGDLARACECNWEKHGSVLEFRRRDWFRRRSSQIPDEWVQSWRDELDKTGTLSLERYAQMVTLTQEQIEENITSDPVLNEAKGVWWAVLNNEGLLRLYLRLDATQRAMLFTQDGLDPYALTPTQWEAYAAIFSYGARWIWGTEAFSDPANSATMKAKSETSEDGRTACTFTVRLDGDGEPRSDEWTVNLPKITRPVDRAK